ncbi:MAG: NAD(P)-dependent oxidoreductase [Solirubrobacterales bacterium]|nr:MAG: NAD(P)-dependent oxidoreductase [Solirubrobacterales bacterium]
MSRVLVTGASGFIGRPAVKALLARGHEVHATCRRAAPGDDDVTWHVTDLLRSGGAKALVRDARATHLLHLAWCTAPGSFWTASENIDWITATLELLRAFGAAGGSRAVVAGSCAEYRWGNETLHEERTPQRPATLYGASKLATRVAAGALCAQQGLQLAWGRIFHLYGPGEDPGRLVAAVARGLLRGERVATSAGLQVRDFLHVDDVAGALVALLDSDVAGTVNVASGDGVAVRDVVEQIALAAGGLDRVDFGARELPVSEPERIVADVARLRREVGYSPAIPLREGIAGTVEWWRERLAEV